MRSYLLSVLLLFLLVDKSLSLPRLPPSFIQTVFRGIKGVATGQAFGYAWQKTLDLIKQKKGSPPPPNAPPVQIKGLSTVKNYFSQFGYLPSSDSFTDYLDEDTISAIKNYQQYFSLEDTGQLDNATLQLMSMPRCGVPDMNFTYDLTTSNVSWPHGKEWFPKGTKELTYGFLPESEIPPEAINVFRDAFKRWSEALITVLNLTETTSFDDADIKIGFYDFDERIEDAVVGATIIRLQPGGTNVKTGEMRLDGNKSWVLPTYNGTWSLEQGDIFLETVVMHQIGHLLGLDHSSKEESVMYPSILPSQQRKVQLTKHDIKSIQQLYTNSGDGGRFTLFGPSWGLLTTLSLGFASMVLLY